MRKDGVVPCLRPAGKTQVPINYEGFTPVSVDTVVVSTQHDESVSQEWLAQVIKEQVIEPVLREENISLDC
ncbi:methionine adenosyltransferase, partial [Actinotignum timonense]|nr:methionine adenosyltransferase [Actinotignum timonense]